MLCHSLDDPMIQFEMARVMSATCKPTVDAMVTLMRAMRYCIDRPTLSWRLNLDNLQQKLAALVGADHASETTRKSMSCYRMYLGHCLIET